MRVQSRTATRYGTLYEEEHNMKITKETVKAVVASMSREGKTAQEIEDNFKAALQQRLISVDIYCMAMNELY